MESFLLPRAIPRCSAVRSCRISCRKPGRPAAGHHRHRAERRRRTTPRERLDPAAVVPVGNVLVGDADHDQVGALEKAGLDTIWVAEAYGFDSPTLMGYLAAKTETVEIGAGAGRASRSVMYIITTMRR